MQEIPFERASAQAPTTSGSPLICIAILNHFNLNKYLPTFMKLSDNFNVFIFKLHFDRL